MQGEVEVGVIVAFISGFERISSPLRELIGFYRLAAQARVQHDLIAQWMDGPRPVQDQPGHGQQGSA
jgi:ABC-type bacteriocin/lantibiotic exporter with double-glycine peptidase domain